MNVVVTLRAHPASEYAKYMRENQLGPFAPDAAAHGWVSKEEWAAVFGPRKMIAADIGLTE